MPSQAKEEDGPRAKQARITLTEEQWRELRVWAATEDKSVQALVNHILSDALKART